LGEQKFFSGEVRRKITAKIFVHENKRKKLEGQVGTEFDNFSVAGLTPTTKEVVALLVYSFRSFACVLEDFNFSYSVFGALLNYNFCCRAPAVFRRTKNFCENSSPLLLAHFSHRFTQKFLVAATSWRCG